MTILGTPIQDASFWMAMGAGLATIAAGIWTLIDRTRNTPPAHVHDWTSWKMSPATLTRMPVFGGGQPMIVDCTLQQRYCNTCGYTETQDI